MKLFFFVFIFLLFFGCIQSNKQFSELDFPNDFSLDSNDVQWADNNGLEVEEFEAGQVDKNFEVESVEFVDDFNSILSEIKINDDWNCVFDVRSEDKELFEKLSYRIDLACERASFIQKYVGFPLRDVYRISFVQDPKFAAYYSGSGNIVISKNSLIAANNSGLQNTLVHEFTHSSLEFVVLPVWFEEGLAERVQYLSRGKEPFFGKKMTVRIENLYPFDTNDISQNSIIYDYANYVVREFTNKYGEDALRETLRLMYYKTRKNDVLFSHSLEKKNIALIEAMVEVTGDDTITLQSIVYPNPDFEPRD